MKNLLLVSLVLLTPAAAQDSQARSDSSSSSHTKRVVVVNGKTVVDEETRDGKPVRGSQRGAAPVDLDRLLKDLEQDLGKGKTSSSSSSSSHSKRVVVINGKTVVDEEIKDGEPVRGSKKGAAPVDLDRLLKDLEQDLGKGKTSSSSSSSSHSKRVVVVNGKTIIDEETRDGEPVRGKGAKARDLDAELDRLLKELEKQGGTVKRSSSSSSSSDRASSKDKDGGRLRRSDPKDLPDIDRLLRELEKPKTEGTPKARESRRSAEAERTLRELEAELKKRSKDKPKETKGKTVVR